MVVVVDVEVEVVVVDVVAKIVEEVVVVARVVEVVAAASTLVIFSFSAQPHKRRINEIKKRSFFIIDEK